MLFWATIYLSWKYLIEFVLYRNNHDAEMWNSNKMNWKQKKEAELWKNNDGMDILRISDKGEFCSTSDSIIKSSNNYVKK